MGKSIIICSAKGGVGKTTVAVNLGVSLARKGNKTVLVDCSITTPDISLMLNLPFYVPTINNVFAEEHTLENALYQHSSGLFILPASIHPDTDSNWFDSTGFAEIISTLKNDFDTVLIDSSAGLTHHTLDVMHYADTSIIVTNPELSSAVNAYKTVQAGKKIGISQNHIVMNRVGRFKDELSKKDLSHFIGMNLPLIGEIPEHHSVPSATAKNSVVVDLWPQISVSKEFHKIAAYLRGEEYKEGTFWWRLYGFLKSEWL